MWKMTIVFLIILLSIFAYGYYNQLVGSGSIKLYPTESWQCIEWKNETQGYYCNINDTGAYCKEILGVNQICIKEGKNCKETADYRVEYVKDNFVISSIVAKIYYDNTIWRDGAFLDRQFYNGMDEFKKFYEVDCDSQYAICHFNTKLVCQEYR